MRQRDRGSATATNFKHSVTRFLVFDPYQQPGPIIHTVKGLKQFCELIRVALFSPLEIFGEKTSMQFSVDNFRDLTLSSTGVCSSFCVLNCIEREKILNFLKKKRKVGLKGSFFKPYFLMRSFWFWWREHMKFYLLRGKCFFNGIIWLATQIQYLDTNKSNTTNICFVLSFFIVILLDFVV